MDVMDEMDKVDVPMVAAIHGTALGGGLEVALACHYRVSGKKAKLGLPEVNLGILPGAGGTQRLPRLVGAQKALDMIVSGRAISASQAKEDGIVDLLVEDADVVEEAVKYASSLSEVKRVSDMAAPAAVDDLSASLKAAIKASRRFSQTAPEKIAEAISAASTSSSYMAGVDEEKRLFTELMEGDQAKAMQYMFFAERTCVKVPNVDPKTGNKIELVGIIGAGTMGGGIAMYVFIADLFLSYLFPYFSCFFLFSDLFHSLCLNSSFIYV